MTERFDLLERVGRGGMGVVWKARDTETGEILALKLVHDLYADDPDYLARLDREVETAQRIDSPHVVRVIGHGRRQGVPFIAMEFVEGESVRERLERTGPLSWTEASNITRQVLVGLDAAHRANVLHRDIKPGNILISKEGVTKLADFGIAKATDMQGLTGSATMLGTPAYMAPDGVESEQSDLYALGCVVYEMLTGSPPFSGSSMQAMIAAHYREHADLSKVPAQARPLIGALLEKDPAMRPVSAPSALSLLVLSHAEPDKPPVPVIQGVALASVPIVPGRTWEVRSADEIPEPSVSRSPSTNAVAAPLREKYKEQQRPGDGGASTKGGAILSLILITCAAAGALILWSVSRPDEIRPSSANGAQANLAVPTNTPLPSPTVVPTPAPGDIVVLYDFTTADFPCTRPGVYLSEGSLVLEVGRNHSGIANCSFESTADVEITARVYTESVGPIVVACRHSANNHEYRAIFYLKSKIVDLQRVTTDSSNVDFTALVSKTLPSYQPGNWTDISFECKGDSLVAKLDGTVVVSANDSTHKEGNAWIGLTGGTNAASMLIDQLVVIAK